MKMLSKSQVLMLHNALISETGGRDGLRNEALLDSALNAPFQTFDNQSLYPTIQSKAARLGYGLIQNHPFVSVTVVTKRFLQNIPPPKRWDVFWSWWSESN